MVGQAPGVKRPCRTHETTAEQARSLGKTATLHDDPECESFDAEAIKTMPRIIKNGLQLFYSVTAQCGSPRLVDPPPNRAEDVLLIQYIFHKILTQSKFRPYMQTALIDSIKMDGIWGINTDYAFKHFSVGVSLGKGDISNRVKPIKDIFFYDDRGDNSTMSFLSSTLLRCSPGLNADNPIAHDMPSQLQAALKANISDAKVLSGANHIPAAST